MKSIFYTLNMLIIAYFLIKRKVSPSTFHNSGNDQHPLLKDPSAATNKETAPDLGHARPVRGSLELKSSVLYALGKVCNPPI